MTNIRNPKWILAILMIFAPLDDGMAGWKIPGPKLPKFAKLPRLPEPPTLTVGPVIVKVPQPNDILRETERVVQNGAKQVTRELHNGSKIITENIPEVGTRVYEVISEDTFKVTETLQNGVERLIEKSADGIHIVEKAGGQLKREVKAGVDGTINIVLEDGSKIITGVTEEGVHLTSEAWQSGTRRLTEITNEGTAKVTEVAKGVTKVVVYLSDAAENARKETELALKKTEKLTSDAIKEATGVAKTLKRYEERQLGGYGDTLSSLERRVKDGKLMDAVWHGAVDPLRGTSKNAAISTQENKYVAIAGAIAASTYGGPAGAAAYASWSTYEATKDPALAMKVGLISGVCTSLNSGVAEMPAVTKTDIALKACAVAANKGVEVATRGGSSDEVKKAMFESMLTSAATATSTSVASLKESDKLTEKAFASAAEAGAKALVNKQPLDSAVKSALLGAISQSICEDLMVATKSKDMATTSEKKLVDLYRVILTGSIEGLGTAALGGDPDEALKSIVDKAGKIVVQDSIDLAKEALSEALKANSDLRALQIEDEELRDDLLGWSRDAKQQFRNLQKANVAGFLELSGIGNPLEVAGNSLSETLVELPGAMISAGRLSSDNVGNLIETKIALVSTAAGTRYSSLTSSLLDEAKVQKAQISELTRVPFGEEFETKALSEMPKHAGVEIAKEILAWRIPAPSKSGSEPLIVTKTELQTLEKEALSPFSNLR